MVKKFICITVIVCTLVSWGINALSSENAVSYKEALNVVSALGFMEGDPQDKEFVGAYTERAAMAGIALRLMGIEADTLSADGVKTRFSDVGPGHWASRDIKLAAERGIMVGYSDGKFYPERQITKGEIAKIIINMLGYRFFAENKGGYPVGYILQGSELGLFKGVRADAEAFVTNGELAQIIYNAMEVDILVEKGFDGSVIMEKEENQGFLAVYHGIYKGQGIMTANSFTRLNDLNGLSENRVAIDDEVYLTENWLYADYLGQKVEFFYLSADNSDVKTLKYVRQKNNNILEVEDIHISTESTATRLVYSKGNAAQSAEIASNANIIYNNAYLCKAINMDLNELFSINGRIRLIDNDNDGKHDNVFITDYRSFVVSGLNSGGTRIYLEFSQPYIELGDRETSFQIFKDNRQIPVSDIKTGDLITVEASKNFYSFSPGRKVIRIYVSTSVIKGSVSSFNDEEVFITEGENQRHLRISPYFVSENGSKVQGNFSGEFYLDESGKLAYYVQAKSGSKKMGYLLEAYYHDKLEPYIQLKVLTPTGKIEYMDTISKPMTDGVKMTSAETITALQESGSLDNGSVGQLIRYDVNEEGKVHFIDTATPDRSPRGGHSPGDPEQLVKTTVDPSTTLIFNASTRLFFKAEERYILGTNTPVFIIPTQEGTTDDDYKAGTYTLLKNSGEYGKDKKGITVSFYNIDGAEPIAVTLVYDKIDQLGGIQLASSPVAVISKRVRTLGEEGMEYEALEVLVNGARQMLKLKDDVKVLRGLKNTETTDLGIDGKKLTYEDLNFGDVIFYEANSKNVVSTVYKINDYPVETLSNTAEPKYHGKNVGGYYEYLFGSVRSVRDRVVSMDICSNSGYLYNHFLGNPPVYLVNTRARTVTVSIFSELRFSEDDSSADKVFARVRFGIPKELVIYR